MKTIRNLVGVLAALTLTAANAAEAVSTAVETKEIVYNEPYFSTEGNRVLVRLLNVDLADIRIKVIDDSGRVLFQELIEEEVLIEKSINFENAHIGEYRIVVEQGDEQYIKRFSVDS